MLNNLRFYVSDEDLNWIHEYKDKNEFKNNSQLFRHLKELAEKEDQLNQELTNLAELTKQVRFTKEQTAILNEMTSEYLMLQGMTIVGNGIDAEIYQSAKRKIKERINNKMEDNGGQK
ncbi:hypothetical protein [Lactobacillus sp. HT06-2]|uniref:hypothetical protein n=1 Tax=Lactobacillus sp. HT06-2 TaxID=2080222 RepID=UPI000CD906DD|nr:hypothetical protein [Lactobacillus sp. HT06-2]